MAKELWQESASSLADLIRSGATSSRDVIESHLGRIDAVNGAVNAVVEVRPDEVRAEADAADAKQKTGEPLGVLHGVPFTVKVNLDQKGYTTNEGCETLKDFMASEDSPPVELMRRAGAVALARTNMPDLGLRINTESSLYGATHNPWKHGCTAGGSSGGEAAAIASGMSPIGLGNDIGGSLRNPAYRLRHRLDQTVARSRRPGQSLLGPRHAHQRPDHVGERCLGANRGRRSPRTRRGDGSASP